MRRPSKLSAAWTAGRIASRRLLGRSVGSVDTGLAEQLADQLDQMKGMAMKVGQVMSYMDVPLPEHLVERLARLQTGVVGMSADQVHEALEASLGAPTADLFEQFDTAPVAAASIGQVHKAKLDGQRVAVKIQYPYVASSFASDLRLLRRIGILTGVATAADGPAIVEEIAARAQEECDYEREARHQIAFSRAFAKEPSVRIPNVIAERSCRTILTSQWVDGAKFEALQGQSVDRKNQVARTLARFTFRSMYELAAVQADPHPGNYLFPDGEATVFLDFGCVGLLDANMVETVKRLARAVRDNDRPAFRQATYDLGMVGHSKRFDFEHHFRAMEYLHRPVLQSNFRFTREYIRESDHFNGLSNPNAFYLAIPPQFVWILRLQLGLWAVLGKLQPETNLTPIFNELLEQPIEPMRPATG